jgi:uncharacterized phiE125 gp8 family phage protein
MNLTVLTRPPFEPVTLAEVYKQLRLDPDHAGSPSEATHPDDAMLTAQITAAREYVENSTKLSLVQQTLRISYGCFPSYCYRGWCGNVWARHGVAERIQLIRPPLIRVERVCYYDGENVLQEMDRADYYVVDEQVPELRFATGLSAPVVYDRPDALRVEYVTGYTPVNSPAMTQADYIDGVPEVLRQAILVGVQLQYDNLPPAEREAMERMRETWLLMYRIQFA